MINPYTYEQYNVYCTHAMHQNQCKKRHYHFQVAQRIKGKFVLKPKTLIMFKNKINGLENAQNIKMLTKSLAISILSTQQNVIRPFNLTSTNINLEMGTTNLTRIFSKDRKMTTFNMNQRNPAIGQGIRKKTITSYM